MAIAEGRGGVSRRLEEESPPHPPQRLPITNCEQSRGSTFFHLPSLCSSVVEDEEQEDKSPPNYTGKRESCRQAQSNAMTNEKLVHLDQRLHRRIDLLPPNFVRPDNSLLLSPESNNGGEQIVVIGNKRAKRPLSTEYAETHYSRKQLPSSPCVLGDKMNLTVRLGKLLYESSTVVPALLPCSQLPRQARGTVR